MFETTLMGNCGADPELKEGKNGSFARVPVAHTEGFGEKRRTIWVNVTVWNEKMAEVLCKYVKKGDKILFRGQAAAGAWIKDGEAKSSVELHVNGWDKMELIGASNFTDFRDQEEPDDDDVPF